MVNFNKNDYEEYKKKVSKEQRLKDEQYYLKGLNADVSEKAIKGIQEEDRDL